MIDRAPASGQPGRNAQGSHLNRQPRVAEDHREDAGRKPDRFTQAVAGKVNLAASQGVVGPVQEGPRQPFLASCAEVIQREPIREISPEQDLEHSLGFVEIGSSGLEPVGFAARVPAHLDRRPGQPGDSPLTRNAEPEVPVQDIAVGGIESADVTMRLGPDRDGRASQGVAEGERLAEASRLADPVVGSQSARLDHARGHGPPVIVDHGRGAASQADPVVAVE